MTVNRAPYRTRASSRVTPEAGYCDIDTVIRGLPFRIPGPSEFLQLEDFETKLEALGVFRRTLPMLALVPVVHFAHLSGDVTESQKRFLLFLAVNWIQPEMIDQELLERWMEADLSDREFRTAVLLLGIAIAAFPEPFGRHAVDRIVKAARKVTSARVDPEARLNIRGTLRRAGIIELGELLRLPRSSAWANVLSWVRDNWDIGDWTDFPRVTDISCRSPEHSEGPFAMTAASALAEYAEGHHLSPDGRILTIDDLEEDIRTEVMRSGRWTHVELDFRATVAALERVGLITDTGSYWNASPHPPVYRINRNIQISLGNRTFRLFGGKHLAFQCRMARELRMLSGPLGVGDFAQLSTQTLCGQMRNAILGRSVDQLSTSLGCGVPAGAASAIVPDETKLDLSPQSLQFESVRVDDLQQIVYFVIDTSGSMQGAPFIQVREAMALFLRRIPLSASVRISLRSFNSLPSRLTGSLVRPYGPRESAQILQHLQNLLPEGATALFQTVARALDDLYEIANAGPIPRVSLIVLSDGEDNCHLEGYRFGGKKGQRALAERMAEFREAGVVEYLPLAYGGKIRALDRIGGPS